MQSRSRCVVICTSRKSKYYQNQNKSNRIEYRKNFTAKSQKTKLKKQGREQGLKEGITKGIEQGIELGIGQGLRVQIQKKLNKGKSISQIADECEESEDTIRKIISEKGIGE